MSLIQERRSKDEYVQSPAVLVLRLRNFFHIAWLQTKAFFLSVVPLSSCNLTDLPSCKHTWLNKHLFLHIPVSCQTPEAGFLHLQEWTEEAGQHCFVFLLLTRANTW